MERRQKGKKKRYSNDTEEEERERSGTFSKLPRDILLDILSRLPAKSLFDCRCVCKFWLTLVRDPRLAKMHLTRASQNENPSILFQSDGNLYLLDNLEESNVPIKLKLPFMASELSSFKLVGSCKGLVCLREALYFNPSIYIFNPVTGEYVKLPKPSIDSENFLVVFAFCYHPPTNKYKVLRLVISYFGNEAEVYTLGSNSWRKIEGADFLFYKSSDAVVNKAIHWFSRRLDIGPMHSPIVSFEVGKEEFGVIEYPAELSPDKPCGEMDMGVLGGCLSLFYSCPRNQNIFMVWVMKEYGVKESWTKQFVIEETGILEGTLHYIRPLCILNNGKILLEHFGRLLVFYDPESKMVMKLEIHGFPVRPYLVKIYNSITHMGSLVSLRTKNWWSGGTLIKKRRLTPRVGIELREGNNKVRKIPR